jgi:hypothetical protein
MRRNILCLVFCLQSKKTGNHCSTESLIFFDISKVTLVLFQLYPISKYRYVMVILLDDNEIFEQGGNGGFYTPRISIVL